MSILIGILSGILIFALIVLIMAEVTMRKNGGGLYQAFTSALQPKATIRFKVIRANGTHEPERLARSGKVTFLARMTLLKISILMRTKIMLDRFSSYLKQLGG